MPAPIPRRLMQSTATVRVPKNDSPYGGEFEEPVTIEYVAFEASASIRRTDYQLEAPLKGTLFIDPKTSIGAFAIPAGSLVSVDSEISEATVHDCQAIPSLANLHHWEVFLK